MQSKRFLEIGSIPSILNQYILFVFSVFSAACFLNYPYPLCRLYNIILAILTTRTASGVNSQRRLLLNNFTKFIQFYSTMFGHRKNNVCNLHEMVVVTFSFMLISQQQRFNTYCITYYFYCPKIQKQFFSRN